MRKHCRRRVITPLPPPGLRPKLDRGQVRDLGLAHIGNLDTIAHGDGNEAVLWQWLGGALTWSRVADQLQQRDPQRFAEAAEAMRTQIEVCTAVVQRYGRTGRVGFSGTEYRAAAEACGWMDALAEVVDTPTALAAATWSEDRVNRMAAQCVRPQEKAAA